MSEPSIHQIAIQSLEPLLGRMTARKAIDLVAKEMGIDAGQLLPAHSAPMLQGLRPMLRTLLGAPATEKVLSEIAARIDHRAAV